MVASSTEKSYSEESFHDNVQAASRHTSLCVICGNEVYDLVVQELSPQEESMQYKAVLDIDGTSWSERFP